MYIALSSTELLTEKNLLHLKVHWTDIVIPPNPDILIHQLVLFYSEMNEMLDIILDYFPTNYICAFA